MAGKINFLDHPVHPMVIVFPLGLLPTAVACDIIYLIGNNPSWAHISYWLVGAGVLSGIENFFRPQKREPRGPAKGTHQNTGALLCFARASSSAICALHSSARARLSLPA